MQYGQHAHATALCFAHSCGYATLWLNANFACSARTTCPRELEETGQTALALGPAEEVQVAGHKAPRKYYLLLVLLAVAQRLYDG